MLYICAAAHVLLAATLAVGSPLEVLESSYRRISSPTQASTGRSFYNARRAPYEILEQSFKFKDPVPQDAGTFASAIRSRLAENEEKIEIRRKIRPPQRLSSLRTRNTQLPVKTLTTKPPKMFVRTSTTKKPSGTTPILVRLTKGSTKPPSLFSSSQTNPIFLRSTSKSQVTPTTSSPIQILETSSRPLNSKPSGGAKNDPFTRSNFSPPSPRRLVNPTKPFRLHSQFRIPASVKQKRPTYMSGSMTINANEDLISTPFPFPDTVKSIRDVVKHLDNEPYQKSTFNTPPTISPTSAPDVAPVTVPMTRTSPPVVKITTKPGHSTTRQAATADRKKFTEWKSSDSEKRIPVTQGPSSPSNTRIQFEDVRPGEVNILRLPISTLNREYNSEKNAGQNPTHTWQVISTGGKNPLQYILHKRPVETSFLSPPTQKQMHPSDSLPLVQKFPMVIQAIKDSFESLTTPKSTTEFAEPSKYSNFEVYTQSSESPVSKEAYFTTSMQGLKTYGIDDSDSKFSVKSSEQNKPSSVGQILEEENTSKFNSNKNSFEEVALEVNTPVKQKPKLMNDIFDSREEFPEKINGLENMSPTGIITYYEKLKHDIYDILNQLQQNQHLEAHKLANEDEFEAEEDEPSEPTLNYNYGEEQESPKIDIEKVLNIMRNFKARTSAEEVPESKLHDIAESIISYINKKDQQSSTKLSYETGDDADQKYRPNYGKPPYSNGPFEYDYHYVYYDDLGNEYLPESSNLFNKNKIISPSDEFTQAFLSKHTSKLSAMLTEVLQNAANNKATMINPLDFLDTNLKNVSTATPISPTLTPHVHSIFTPFNQLPLTENPPSTTRFPFEADVTFTTISYPPQTEEMGFTEPTTTTEQITSSTTETTTSSTTEITTNSATETATSEIPTTTSMPKITALPSKDSSFSDTQKRQTSTTSASNRRPTDAGSNTRWTSIGPSSSPNRKKNQFSLQSNQLFGQRRPQRTNAKVKYDYDKSDEVKEVLPHPGAGNTALETLAGAGAVALMAYGISYALPLAAPLVLRRSGSSRESPISRFMNWLDISGSEGKKKRRKGVKKVYKNTSGYPMISVRNSTMLGPLNYDDYDDDYHTDYYEFGKTGQKITNYDDYDIEDIPTRYRSDFKGTIPYEDSSYPFPSKFNHMARIDTSSANDKKVTERKTDVQSPIKHIGSDYFSFGYDPTDGAIGDDPPNESAVFGKVTYEYDFTNTHINPAVVGTDVRSDFYGLSDAQSQLESKGEIPARGTFQQGAPVRAGAPAPPRSDRKPKPPQSSNFLSNIFGNIFSRRSNTGNVHPPQASRRAPQNLAPIRGSRIPPHGHPRTVVQSSENPSYSHRSIEMVNRAPPKGFPIHFSHPGASRTPTGARPRTDGDFFAKEETDRKDDIAVGGGGAILPSDLSKTGGGGIPLPPQSISSMNTRTRNKNSQYPSYVSLEQVNRLAEEEMEGVVRGYSRLHDAPWPPPEGSQIIEDKLDLDGAGSKVYLFDETDLKNGYHLNADSTDYIYKTNDNSYKNSPLSHGVETKPATLKTLAPDYNDFDYVDIKGSSADIDTQRSFSFPAAGSGKE